MKFLKNFQFSDFCPLEHALFLLAFKVLYQSMGKTIKIWVGNQGSKLTFSSTSLAD